MWFWTRNGKQGGCTEISWCPGCQRGASKTKFGIELNGIVLVTYFLEQRGIKYGIKYEYEILARKK